MPGKQPLIFEMHDGPQVWLEDTFINHTDEGDTVKLRVGDPGGFGLLWSTDGDNTNALAMTRRFRKILGSMEMVQDKMTADEAEATLRVFWYFMARFIPRFLRDWEQGVGVWR